MSYCQPGNLQNTEMGLRRSKQNTFVGTVKHPHEKTLGIPKVFTLQHYIDRYMFKSLFPQKRVALSRQGVCVHAHVQSPVKTT